MVLYFSPFLLLPLIGSRFLIFLVFDIVFELILFTSRLIRSSLGVGRIWCAFLRWNQVNFYDFRCFDEIICGNDDELALIFLRRYVFFSGV